MEKETKKLISDLEALIKHHLKIAIQMMKAEGGAIYRTDLFFNALLNLSYNLSKVILKFIKEKNILVAAPLLRMQLENLLKTYYISRLKEVKRNKLIDDLLNGTRFDKIKDENNQRLTNARLLMYASRNYNWLNKVYEDTCKFVHFSERHFFINVKNVMDNSDSFILETIIGKGTPDWPEKDINNFIRIQKKITTEILRHAYSWAKAKDNVKQ